jgi:DNA-binding response OmpR family regulator
MDPIVCFPNPAPAEILLAITQIGYPYHCVSSAAEAEGDEARLTELGWSGAVVAASPDLADALAVCRALRKREQPVGPLLLVIHPGQLSDLSLREDLFDDFCLSPMNVSELSTRLTIELERRGRGINADVVDFGPLQINLATYQAAIAGRVLDLTYMEYELLKFLASHPLKVFTRETLLSRVWGYEYYGGARTVDVHVRRLRAKLGEEHAHLIQTVRSVGYRFGQQGWSPDS